VSQNRSPLPLLLGVALMALLGSWGVIEWDTRRSATLGGRVAVSAPEWAAPHHWDVCRLAGRCEAPWQEIRWFAVDSTALPAVICPGAAQHYSEVWGCWEWETNALTLVRSAYADTAIVRHELMHAALGPRWTGRHPCRWFNPTLRTAQLGACD
jgi:hypothetical protein